MGPRFVSIVTLGSATGRYGGPYDTAVRQARIASENGAHAILLAGFMEGDKPSPSSELGDTELRLVKVRRVLPTKGYTGLFSASFLLDLVKCIRSSDYIRVSTARELVPVAAIVVALLLGKPIVVQPHGMLTSRSSALHKLIDILLRPLVRRSAVVVSLTDVEQAEVISWLGGKRRPIMQVLGNPVPFDIAAYRDGRPKGSDAVFIARLHPRKRVDVFIEASEISQGNSWPEKYVVVGPDDGDLSLVTAKVSNGNQALVYEGAVGAEQVTDRVSRAGVFVLTSFAEPWGNVLAIALACGVPVVVPRSAALAGQIERAGAGVVVSDGDAAGFAEAIHQLLNDADVYGNTSRAALALAESLLSRSGQARSWKSIEDAVLTSGVGRRGLRPSLRREQSSAGSEKSGL